MKFAEESIQAGSKWLGEQGADFFRQVIMDYGTLNACWMEGDIPHPVHFREGMQVRNFMRGLDEFKGWDAHALDGAWESFILECIGEDKCIELIN